MKKLTLFLTIFLFAFTFLNAQNFTVLLVDDDNNGASETATIETALTNSGYTWQKASNATPSFSDMEQYDLVLWFTGNDQTTNLWKTDANENSTYNDALIQFAKSGGIVWVDGLEFFYDILGAAPDDFAVGTFVNDTLGISRYSSQSYADDGNNGVPQYDKVVANVITTPNPINWEYATLLYADGFNITATANSLYEMMGGAYVLAGDITALYNQVGNSTFITTGFRISKFTDQVMKNTIVSEMLTYAEANWDTEVTSVSPSANQTIQINTDGTELTVTETVGWDSREWKYATTSGGAYSSFGTPVTTKTYTPNFATTGTYYVVCSSVFGTSTLTSNEVQISVTGNSNSIAPIANQHLINDVNGNVLTVTESPAATSREWKYTTTSGSNYQSFSTPVYATTYTPNFDSQGIYYVVCVSNIGGIDITSNEVKIVVDNEYSEYYLESDGDDSFFINDNANNDLDVTAQYTYETWVKVNEYNNGDYSRIMFRDNRFSLYLINDDDDDFAILFKSYMASAPSISSENSVVSNLEINKWFHVAVTRDGVDTKLFIDGVKIAESSHTDFMMANSVNSLNFGARYDGNYSNYLKGSLENIHVSNIARYSADFTPDFYAQQQADANSIVCLNLENNGGTDLFDASGNFTSISLRSSTNDAEWKLKAENSVSPIAIQNINQNANGTELTVTENGIVSSTEWKYATTSGGAYSSFGVAETNKTYTPNFANPNTYYVVCVSNFNGTEITSNEVEINVSASATLSTSAISGSPFYVSATTGTSVDVSYTLTGTYDVANTFTAYLSDATGDFTTETAIGTLITETAGTINATIPANTTAGSAYRIRVKSDTPPIVGTDNGTNLEIVLLENLIAPANTQIAVTDADGTELTVTETIAATSREWKFTTTSGSGYTSFGTAETGTAYTPNFSTQGVYYVVCESDFSGTILTSNEVKVVVDVTGSDYYLEFDGDDSFYVKDDNQDFINVTNNYTFETWVKVAERADGTYPVIMDRYKCFSLFVQGDGSGTDDFSIAFVTRDASNSIIHSLSSADLSSVDFNFNEWYHVAIQYDGTDAKMYIDGSELVTNNTDDFSLLASTSNFINVGVRFHTSGYENYFNGSLENIQISNTARYNANFTPGFYTQQIADESSVVCLNLENNTGTALFDASGHFNNIILAGGSHEATWKLKVENSIDPTDIQNVIENADGTELTVLENGLALSTEWKFSTTSGSGYVSFGIAETEMIYTPNFATMGTYYVVCVSNFNGTEITSNEVQVNVTEEFTITTGTVLGSPFAVTNVTGVSVDVPFTITGLFNLANVFTAYLSDANGDFTSEIAIGNLVSATSGTITAEIPANTVSGTLYRIRVKSDNPVIVGTDNGVDLEVDLTSGVNDIANSKIKIYPNPASDILYIEVNSKKNNIQIFDNLGRLVSEQVITNNSVNVSNLNSGIYTIIVKTENELKRSQFIKK